MYKEHRLKFTTRWIYGGIFANIFLYQSFPPIFISSRYVHIVKINHMKSTTIDHNRWTYLSLLAFFLRSRWFYYRIFNFLCKIRIVFLQYLRWCCQCYPANRKKKMFMKSLFSRQPHDFESRVLK